MFSSPPSNRNPKTTTLDTVAERENLNCISIFRLPMSVVQYINSRLIFHGVHINDPTIALDVKLNSWVLNYLESYQLSPSLFVDLMLKVFCKEFYGWGYIEFSRLN